MAEDFDGILDELGHFGRYQQINYLLLFFPLFMSSSVVLTFAFAAGEPDYRCLVPECENGTESALYSPPWLSNAIPIGSDDKPSECTRYAVNTAANWTNTTCPANGFLKNATQECHDLVFRGGEVTIVNDKEGNGNTSTDVVQDQRSDEGVSDSTEPGRAEFSNKAKYVKATVDQVHLESNIDVADLVRLETNLNNFEKVEKLSFLSTPDEDFIVCVAGCKNIFTSLSAKMVQ